MKKTNSQNWNLFFGRSIQRLVKNGIRVELVPQKKIRIMGSYCSGYFCDEDKTLKVSTLSYNWKKIYIHEYCHFLQFIDKKYISPLDRVNDLDDFFRGKLKLKEKEIKDMFWAYQNIEVDCEKRVIKLCKKYNIGINKKQYIKEANAYLFMYSVMLKQRKWMKKSPLALNDKKTKEILSYCPDRFLKNYKKIPKEFEELALKYCF